MSEYAQRHRAKMRFRHELAVEAERYIAELRRKVAAGEIPDEPSPKRAPQLPNPEREDERYDEHIRVVHDGPLGRKARF